MAKKLHRLARLSTLKFDIEIKAVIARWFSRIKDGTVLNFKAYD